MASAALLDLRTRSQSAWPRIAPAAVRVVQGGWVLFVLAGLVLAAAATPAVHGIYQTTCPDPLCDLISQPNARSVELLAQAGIPLSLYATVMVAVDWLLLAPWLVLGALVMRNRPRDPVGLIVAFGAFAGAMTTFLTALKTTHPEVTLPSAAASLVAALTLPLMLGLFPNGHWAPRWIRWVVLAILVEMTIKHLAGPLPSLLDTVTAIAVVPLWFILAGAQIHRYRRVSTQAERQQMKWLLFGVSVYLANVLAAGIAFAFGIAQGLQFVFLPFCHGGFFAMGVAICFAILRYHLFDIDAIINRALVYLGLTAAVVAIYALIAGGIDLIFRAHGGAIAGLAAAVAVALLFAPLRDRIQRGATRLVYGERDEPYAVIARLGRRLEATLAPETVLPTIIETVATALKLPYAAIALRQGDDLEIAAEYGATPVASPVAVPLSYQGEPVGELRLAPRIGERALSRADRRLLDDLAAQAGVASHAVQLTRDLQQARERLVTAREEERRRLRRDLHDGLGPTIASQALTIDAVRALLVADPTTADALLLQLKLQGQNAMTDVRRLVYALRPPALDDHGLLTALRQEAETHQRGELRVTMSAPESLPPLPAAVEVAAYRISQEALTNVSRHAGASSCTLQIELGKRPRELILEIADDGQGFSPYARPGVGTASMRERAEELGGVCTVAARPEGGVLVRARLPLPRED